MRTSGLLGDKLEAMPTEMLDSLGMDAATMGTGWGYTHQTVFSMLGMLLLLVVGIIVVLRRRRGRGGYIAD